MLPEQATLDQLPAPVYTTDEAGIINYYNEAAAEAWGRRPELGRTRWCGSYRLYTAKGEPLPHDQCPVAQSLRQGQPVENVTTVVERPDGSRLAFRPRIRLLRDEHDGVTGAIVMASDTSADAAVDGERLAAIVSSSSDAIISKDIEGRITTWNGGATRILGYSENEMIGQSILRLIPPELRHEEDLILSKISRGERVAPFDTVRVAKDGRRVDLSLTISPLRDCSGRVVGASKVARDITERKRHDETQRLLIDELNHRVRNTLATIKAIAHQSMRRSVNPRSFVDSFNGRLHALAHAHDLLVERHMSSADLVDLVREQVVLAAPDERITCSGPSIDLPPQVAVQLALVLHELATNARRHGALSQEDGKLSVTWARTGDDGDTLELHWKESGRRNVAAPVNAGFGLRMIERSLAANEGKVDLRFEPDGLLCHLHLPLHAYSDIAADLSAAPADGEPCAPQVQLSEQDTLAGKRVLVVEDEALIAMELEQLLRGLGCEVVGPAVSIDQAQALLEEGGFDMVLLDGNLNGKRSDTIAFKLAGRGMPFAYSTGYGRDSLPSQSREQPLLSKPFTENELRMVLLEILNASQS